MDKQLRAQLSIEFIIMMSITLVSFILMYLVYFEQLQRINAQREGIMVQDLGLKYQKELLIASKVSDGYYRKFSISSTLNGINYSITRENNTIVVESNKGIVHLRIPQIIGNPRIGNNSINKTGGVIYLN